MRDEDEERGYDLRAALRAAGSEMNGLGTSDGEGVEFERRDGVPVFRERASGSASPDALRDPGTAPWLDELERARASADGWSERSNVRALFPHGIEDGVRHRHDEDEEDAFAEPDPEELQEALEGARASTPAIVTLCERRVFSFSEGPADIVVTRFLPCCEWPDVTLQVLVHEVTIPTGAEIRVRAYAAAPNIGDDEVLADPTPVVTSAITPTTATDTLLTLGIVPGRVGEGIQIRVDGNPPTIALATTTARLTIQAVMRPNAPPRPILDGNTTVYGALAVSDGTTTASLSLDRSTSTIATMEWREAGVLRWRLLNSNLDGDLKLERYNASGVLQDAPLTIESGTGRIRGKMPYTTMTGYDDAGTSRRFIVFSATGSNSTLSNGNNNSNWVVPWAGRLLKVTVFTSSNAGSTSVCFHKNLDTSVDSSREVVQSVGATTAVEFDFTGKSVSFAAGDRVSLSVDPTNTPNDVNVTCVWELEY